jgi:hypothetical protein
MDITKAGGTMPRQSTDGRERQQGWQPRRAILISMRALQAPKAARTNLSDSSGSTRWTRSGERLSSISPPRFQLTAVENLKERVIMKTKTYTTILTIIVLMLFGAVDALAQTEQSNKTS